MPRNYQPKRNNPYLLDHDLYMQVLYLVKRYPALIEKYHDVIHNNPPPPDGMPKGNQTGNPTENKAMLLIEISGQIKAIEQTAIHLKDKYEITCTGEAFEPYEAFIDYGVFCYFRSDPDKDEAPSQRTWKRYRSEFVWNVAKKLKYL